jgi:predicted DNA-binding protein with PD1-like motif
MRFLDALAALVRDHRAESASLTFSDGAFGPFAYVMPALSEDASHAAFYSATFRPAGSSRVAAAAVTFGTRDDAPFFHCHAFWRESDGALHGGHVLPEDTMIAEPIRVRGVAMIGARFEAHQDPETGFRLFGPVATGTAIPAGSPRGVAVRLRPNQDITAALEAVGRQAGFERATVHGGVGSIIGARFTDGVSVDAFATEMLMRDGRLKCAPEVAGPPTHLDVALVDYTGALNDGVLVAGDNPVLMTFECVIAA